MRIFIIGAGGYVGSAIAGAVKAAGHEVTALARDAGRATTLNDAGIQAVLGDIADPKTLETATKEADAVVFAAFVAPDLEAVAVRGLVEQLRGTDKALLFMSGASMLAHATPLGEWREETYAEDDPFFPPAISLTRLGVELMVRGAAAEGVRGMILRPPMIWGNGASIQLPLLFENARTTGAACYVGAGLNVFSHVHVDDIGAIACLALERGHAGAVYHAVSGENDFRTIAGAVAAVMKCETRSIAVEDAGRIWGPVMGPVMFAHSCRTRAPRTRAELGWVPLHADLIQDIVEGSYRRKYGAA